MVARVVELTPGEERRTARFAAILIFVDMAGAPLGGVNGFCAMAPASKLVTNRTATNIDRFMGSPFYVEKIASKENYISQRFLLPFQTRCSSPAKHFNEAGAKFRNAWQSVEILQC